MLRDVAFISEELAEQLFDQTWNRHAIIDIAGCDAELQDFASIIDHQVQLEAKEQPIEVCPRAAIAAKTL